MPRERNLITALAALVALTALAESCADNAEQCEQTGQCGTQSSTGGGGTGGAQPAHCSPGTICDDGNPCTDDSCDPASGCVNSPLPAATTLCDGGVCDGSGECLHCGDSVQCPDGFGCGAGGLCLLVDGAACQDGNECQHAHCVDGVCCNTSCDEECRACNLSEGDTEPGTCHYVLAGQGDSTCPSPSSCNGFGNCQHPLGEACGLDDDCLSGYCNAGTCE
ncbi:MAG: hypothetical protein IT372_13390 [Polyangiaceae bacterium]|nr:hypothetical protein [Polyangiaceae bacterium]